MFNSKHKPPKITLTVVAGKKMLGMGLLSKTITMKQNENGEVSFSSLKDETFYLTGYEWGGPSTATVTTSNSDENKQERSGRKGRLVGAVIGTALMPGVGTVIGLAAGTGKKTKGKTHSTTNTKTKEVEEETTATIVASNTKTNETITFGVVCNSSIDISLKNFDWSHAQSSNNQVPDMLQSESEKIELLKEYKGLLDEGIISSDEFEEKKRALMKA